MEGRPSMDVTNTSALARYFAGRVEKARDALSAVHLPRYADEVCIMLPKSAEEFARFVHWCEGMASCLARWAALPKVQASVDAQRLTAAREAVESLARDARELLKLYEARRARGL
jgi:hypothetical protein